MTPDNETLLPLTAINVQLLPEFRHEILEETLAARHDLADPFGGTLNRYLREKLRVNGFRNANAAPLALQVRSLEDLFIKEPEAAKVVLEAWSSLYAEQIPGVAEVIGKLGLKPASEAIGFENVDHALSADWPEGVDYDKIFEAYQKKEKSSDLNKDKVALLAVLISRSLPG